MIVTLLALFGAGLTSFLAPCVLPVVPGIVGVLAAGAQDRRGAVAAVARFVVGFSAMFTVVGVAGGALAHALASVAAVRAAGALVVACGVVLATGRGLPGSARVVARGGPTVAGAAFAVVWTPCVGPLAGAALVAASATGTPWRAGAALAAYAAGIGVPFVAVAAGLTWSRSAQRALRRAGATIAHGGGALLVLLGGAMVTGHYGRLVSLLRVAG